MNYRHIFHAGNRCDVVKHAVLMLLIDHLESKDKPFAFLDTHAGPGLYDLEDERALKTSEARDGILKLLKAPLLPELAAYYEVLRKLNPSWHEGSEQGFRYYPGSPRLVYERLRPHDRLMACEMHPEDASFLQRQFHDKKQAHIHMRDGYGALGALLPPPEKRGLVLIDPPYEEGDEFLKLVEAVKQITKRWAEGLAMIWYPIKDRPTIWKFHENLIHTAIPKQLCAEFIFEEEARSDRLNGSGFILINPPWQIEDKLSRLFLGLHQALETPYQGISVQWLRPEG